MSKENQEYYNLYYKNKSKGLSSNEKKRMNDLSYQKAMEVREQSPKRYGLMLIGIAYEEMWKCYTNSKKTDCVQMLYLIDRLKIRMNEIRFIYSLTKDEIRAYFERNHYNTSFYLK